MRIQKQKIRQLSNFYYYSKCIVALMFLICLVGCEKKTDKDDSKDKIKEVKSGTLTVTGLPEVNSTIVGFYVRIFKSDATFRLVSYNASNASSSVSYFPEDLFANGYSSTSVFSLYKTDPEANISDSWKNFDTKEGWNDSGTDLLVILTGKRFCGANLDYKKATVTFTNGIGEVNYSAFTPIPITP
jgi:hypothetical protein